MPDKSLGPTKPFPFSIMPDKSYFISELRVRIDEEKVHINIDQAHEVRYWKIALDCTEEQLRMAVATVGTLVTDVRAHLRLKEKN
jgi:hypothetical protein